MVVGAPVVDEATVVVVTTVALGTSVVVLRAPPGATCRGRVAGGRVATGFTSPSRNSEARRRPAPRCSAWLSSETGSDHILATDRCHPEDLVSAHTSTTPGESRDPPTSTRPATKKRRPAARRLCRDGSPMGREHYRHATIHRAMLRPRYGRIHRSEETNP